MYLDRDFLETPEGFLFCVVGCVHPKDRVIAYLKYVPSQDGRWGQGNRRFRRTMDVYSVPQVLKNVEMLRTQFPQYVFRSRVMNILMSAVPRRLIVRHYRPAQRLSELFRSHGRDGLEQDVIDFVHRLSHDSGVDQGCFGVTGSILKGIHQMSFSDIDITVYGLENTLRVRNVLLKEFRCSDSDIRLPQGEERERMLGHWARNYGLSLVEVEWFAGRKWNRGFFRGRPFSLLPVHRPSEVKEKYGDERYYPEGIVEGDARVIDAEDSLFLPCTYGVVKVDLGRNTSDVEKIVSYDGFYSGIFQVDDAIRFRGKLERVVEKGSGREVRRILIGSPEARGLDYIRPKLAGNDS
jgi:hypothetical protein